MAVPVTKNISLRALHEGEMLPKGKGTGRVGPSAARARKAMKKFRQSLHKFDPQPLTNVRRTRPTFSAIYVVRSETVVKLGITGNLDARLAKHRSQGLWKVVYVLHSPDANALMALERSWKQFVRHNPHLKVSREVLPDGYTEASPLTQEVRDFIDKLLKEEKR